MSVLKIHVTYQCSAECPHCHLGGHRSPDTAIDLALAVDTIRELHRLNSLDLVVLLGGEPGLFPDLLTRIVESTNALEIATRVETNASWAEDGEKALEFLKPFQAWHTQFMFSLDSFHEPFVDPKRVQYATLAACKLALPWSLEVPYLDFVGRANSFDRRTTELLNALLESLEAAVGAKLESEPDSFQPGYAKSTRFNIPDASVFEGRILFKGRAAHKLAPLVAQGRGVPTETCAEVPWWSNGSQSTLDLLALDPEGNISKECGVAIGNVRENSVQEILETFDASRHPILAKLIESGPLGLAREAEELGYVIKPDYADKCHLCQEAREVLRAKHACLRIGR